MSDQWESLKMKVGEINPNSIRMKVEELTDKAKPIAKNAVEFARDRVEKVGEINQDTIKTKVGEMTEKARPIALSAVDLAIEGVDKIENNLDKLAKKLDKNNYK